MKKILLTAVLMLFVIVTISAQNEKQIYMTGNYNFLARNMQHGAGYALGYNHQFTKLFWLDSEFSYGQAMGVKGDTLAIGRFTTLPLTYLTSGYYLTLAPTFRFKFAKRISFAFGIGFAACYQSSLYNTYHYTIPDGMFGEEELTGIEFQEGYHIGSIFNLQVGVDIDPNWALILKGTYLDSFMAGKKLTAGLGVAYTF
jgi:uncharacterized membrane protein YciS (DUF1049 family)